MNAFKDHSFCLIYVAVVILLYSNSIFGGFIWDDRAAVVTISNSHMLTSNKFD